ncbi:MAG: hypothetical protein ACLTFJ_08200 [Clostridium sp.]
MIRRRTALQKRATRITIASHTYKDIRQMLVPYQMTHPNVKFRTSTIPATRSIGRSLTAP